MIRLTQSKQAVTRYPSTSQFQQLLAIEWRPSGTAVLAMVKQGDVWPIAYEFERKWTDEAMAAGVAQRADELRTFIAEKHLTGKPDSTAVTFSIDPALVISKRFELPLINDATVHDAVSLELESRGLNPSEYISDYVVHRVPNEPRMIISSISAPVELIVQLRGVAEQIGCTLLSIGLGEYGLAEIQSDTSDQSSLHLLADRLFMQLILTSNGLPLAEFRFPYPNNPSIVPKLIEASLERLVQPLPVDLLRGDMKRLTIVGERAQDVAALLRNSEFNAIEPKFADLTKHLWRAWGSTQQWFNHRESFNLCHPKQGVDHRAVKQAKRIRLGLWAASMLALLGYSLYEYHRQLDQQTHALQVKLSRMEGAIEEDRPIIDAVNQLAEWERLPLHLSAQLPRVLRQLPEHDRVFLNSLQVDQGDDEQAEVRLEGLARELDDALEIPQRLISSGFELRPHRIDHNEADPHYRTRFAVTAKLATSGDEQADQFDAREMQLTSKEMP